MFTLIKWLGGLFITLVLLVILAVFFIPKFIDPNDYRDEIVALVKDKTDRELRLDGDLSISVFPWLGVQTQGLAFAQPESIKGDLVSVENAQLRVKLIPLLSKRVEIDTVVLDEPLLRIVTLKNGVDSFSGLTGDDEVQEQETGGELPSDVALVIEGLQINNAQVIIDDRSEGQRYEISDFDLTTGNLISGGLADVNASGLIKDSSNPDVISFELTTLARVDIDTLLVQLADLRFQTEISGNKINASLDELLYEQPSVVTLDGVSAQLSGEQEAQVSVQSVVVDLDKQTAQVSPITLASNGLKAIVSGLVANKIVDAPSVKGKLSIEEFNARPLVKSFQDDFETSNPDALKRVAFTSGFHATTEVVNLSGLALSLDDSNLKGSARVSNFDDPRIKFDLTLDKLNLDDYLPEDEEEASEDDAPFDPEALKVPMDVFKSINVNGRFVATQFISAGLEFNDIDVTIASSGGNVTITPKANLYDGKTDGVIRFSESSGVSKLKINNEVDLVSLGEMLDQADITDQLSGLGSLIIDMVVTEKNGVQSNEGTIKLVAKNGALKGIDLQNIVQSGYSKYRDFKGRSLTEEETTQISGSSEETKFAELLGTFHVKDYKISNDDFSMKAPLFRISGAGDILMDSQTLDYKVNFSVVNSLKGQGGDAFDKLVGLTIPIRLTGDLSSPSYSVDWSSLYKSLAKQKVNEEKAKLLKDKLGIEGGEDLSTKGVLKQLLINEVNESSDGAATESRDSDDERSTKDQLKDELKNKLLKGLFN